MRLNVDRAGRVVLPKPMRDELQLEPGDALEAELSFEQITLRPVRGNAPIRKKHGIWVYSSGQPLSHETVEETLRHVRREREALNAGKMPPYPSGSRPERLR